MSPSMPDPHRPCKPILLDGIGYYAKLDDGEEDCTVGPSEFRLRGDDVYRLDGSADADVSTAPDLIDWLNRTFD